MGTPRASAVPAAATRRRIWLAVILLAVGLLGHLLAAHEMGGSALAYRHHIGGFLLLSSVSALILAALGWVFWRGRHDITLLMVGALQAVLGLLVYINQIP